MVKLNATEVLMGFLWKEENQLSPRVFEGNLEKGFKADQTQMLSYLMKFQEFISENQG